MQPSYQLLDFGDGRKLELFGGVVVDRPAPHAWGSRRQPERWGNADLRYLQDGTHRDAPEAWQGAITDDWTFSWGQLTFHLKPAPTGQVGVFPEQLSNWAWLQSQVQRLRRSGHDTPQVLNLFAYTGGSTLAVAGSGGAVTHIDSSKPVVAWARVNAATSSLSRCPIRWIVEDVSKFVRREVRRERRYRGIILDPPTFGRGPAGERWRVEDDLPKLLHLLNEILLPDGFLLLTCHTTGIELQQLQEWAEPILPRPGETELTRLALCTPQGDELPAGMALRWQGAGTSSERGMGT